MSQKSSEVAKPEEVFKNKGVIPKIIPDMKKLKKKNEKKMMKSFESANKNEEQAVNKNKDKLNNSKEKRTLAGNITKSIFSSKKRDSASLTDKATSSSNPNTGSNSHPGSLLSYSNISDGNRNSKHQNFSTQSHVVRSINDEYPNSPLGYPPPTATNGTPPPCPEHTTHNRVSSLPSTDINASANISTHRTEPSLSQEVTNIDRKDETKTNESEYLKFLDVMLKQISDYEANQSSTRDATAKLVNETKQLQQKKDANASKIKGLQVELYDLLKQVKVTDDDLSTIQKKLAALSGKLSNFPPNSKKSFNKKEPVKSKAKIIEFFKDCWDKDTAKVIENLFQNHPDIDYALVSVLVEKLIIDHFVQDIFKAPIYMDFTEINGAYQTIEKLFEDAEHPEWNSNLRLRCVKATLTEIERDSGVAERSKNSKTALCNKLLEKLSAIYDKNDITPRIKKLVEMASDLSFPMNSQEERIKIRDLKPGDFFYTNQVKAQYGSDKSPNKVELGISPVFLIKNSIHFDEDDEEHMDYDDGRSFDGDNSHDYDDDDEGDEEDEEKEKPNIGSYEDNQHTLVYAGRAIGYNEDSRQDEQMKTEV